MLNFESLVSSATKTDHCLADETGPQALCIIF